MKTRDFSTIQFHLSDGIGHLELSQPPSNKMTLAFFGEFTRFVDRAENFTGMKALVLSGKGRHFSSGADLPSLLDGIGAHSRIGKNGDLEGVPDFMLSNYRSFMKLDEFRIPVISAIRGVCVGSALELALFCHFRFCDHDAVFGMPESSYNLIPGLGGISKMARLTGKATALEMILKGNTFPASEALRIGVVDRLFPKKEVVAISLDFASKIMNGYRKEKSRMYLKKYLVV